MVAGIGTQINPLHEFARRFDRENRAMRGAPTALGLAIFLLARAGAAMPAAAAADAFVVAQAMVPPTGMEDANKPMPMEERMRARFPQQVRVGDLIGLPVLDESASTIGHVTKVVRTKDDKIALIVAYGGLFGWGARPVAVPIEAVGVLGRQIASLDMAPSQYASAPSWRDASAQALPDDATIRIALARR
jgi:hypothetical protein